MKNILVVDDEKDYRDILSKKLKSDGYQVTEAVDGGDALRIVRQQMESIDLILLDLKMPAMDGLTFYFYMKQSVKKYIPIIILTNIFVSAYPAEIKDYIIKTDITLDKLVEKIHNYLS